MWVIEDVPYSGKVGASVSSESGPARYRSAAARQPAVLFMCDVVERTGLSHAKLRWMVEAGTFPKARPLIPPRESWQGGTGWLVWDTAEVERWIAEWVLGRIPS